MGTSNSCANISRFVATTVKTIGAINLRIMKQKRRFFYCVWQLVPKCYTDVVITISEEDLFLVVDVVVVFVVVVGGGECVEGGGEREREKFSLLQYHRIFDRFSNFIFSKIPRNFLSEQTIDAHNSVSRHLYSMHVSTVQSWLRLTKTILSLMSALLTVNENALTISSITELLFKCLTFVFGLHSPIDTNIIIIISCHQDGYPWTFLTTLFYHIYQPPPLGQDMTQGQFLRGV